MSTTPTIRRAPDVCAALKISKSTLYAWVKDGTFTPPVKLGIRVVGWLDSDIAEFIQARAAERARDEA